MRKILNESDKASQTYTIEWFLFVSNLPSANLTVTSMYCSVLSKWVATQYGIHFRKSAGHFSIYFYTLLHYMYYKDFQIFVDEYMGMVADFSLAQMKGFKNGMMKQFNVSEEDFTKDNVYPADFPKDPAAIPMEKFYAFCHVHFGRSEC